MRHLKLDHKRVYYLEPKTAKILTIKLSLEHPICHSGGENHKTHLSFSFLIYFPSFFLVKQTESNFVRERERARESILGGIGLEKREEGLEGMPLKSPRSKHWRQSIYLSQSPCFVLLAFIPLFLLYNVQTQRKMAMGFFTVQGFRFGFWGNLWFSTVWVS